MSAMPRVEILARLGGQLLEGPAWDAPRARLLLVDIDGSRRHAVDWATGNVTTHRSEDTASAWIPRAAGGTVVVCRRGVRLADDEGVGPLAMPVPRPTSCCFAGPSLDRLVVTTAASDDGAGGDLFVCDVGVAGTPTVAFAG